MFNIHLSTRLARRENKRALKVLNYLKTAPNDVQVYIPDQLADGAFIYKAVVITPVGCFRFDTSGSHWIRKPSAKRAVSTGYRLTNLDRVLANWRDHELLLERGRQAEQYLINSSMFSYRN